MNQNIPGTPAYRQYTEYLEFHVAMLRCKHKGVPTREQLAWRLDVLVRRGNPYVEKALEDLEWTFGVEG